MKNRIAGFIRFVIIVIALCVFGYAAYQLYLIMNDYRETDKKYSDLRDRYTTPSASSADADEAPEIAPKFEDKDAPISVDWNELKALNEDIVGWIYVDAEPSISYPICWKKEDDDFYLHRSHTKEYLYAGSIFLEGLNNPDFSDPLSIVYGHNMKNGSMFAKLKNLLNQEEYDKNPYFWILTPQGNYRYHIFSVFQTDQNSAAYALFSQNDEEFLEYEKQMQNASAVKNDVQLYDDDKCVLLSTCVSDHVHRTVVIGRCVSSNQPQKLTDDPAVKTTKDKTVIVPTVAPEPFHEVLGNLFGVEGTN